MTWKLYGVIALRCERCFVLFCVPDVAETRGGIREIESLLINPCRVCGKGSVNEIGHLYWKPLGHEREDGAPTDACGVEPT